MHRLSNEEITKILSEISLYLEMQDVPFKPRAYERAALNIEALNRQIFDIYQKDGRDFLNKIPGVGESIAEKIEELLKTGKLKYYEQLKKKTPVDIAGLTAIEGIGPKMVKKLYQKLRIRNIKDLEKAAKSGKIKKLTGFGKKSETNILQGIQFLRRLGGRFLLGDILPIVREIENRLKKLKQVKKIYSAGSIRRWKETIGDADFLAISSSPEPIMNYFVSMPEVAKVYAQGKTKSAIRLKNGLDVDIRVIPEKSFGAALMYFTGSKDHNIKLREIAIKKGYKLNEYGLFKGKKLIAAQTEEEVYKKLGLDFIKPEMRENSGEIELALKKSLPKLIGYKDLKGDLQIQTNWTDGANSIEEMAETAIKLGLEYIAITDHTKSLAMTGGSDEKKLLRQMEYIDKINLKLSRSAGSASGGKIKNKKFRILKGVEVNIMKDGSLDIDDKVLAKLDVVGASIHSHFNLPRSEQTKRLIRAMENKNVDIIFHPTGRVINKREACDLDIDEIIRTAKRTKTILEINAFPSRLDLKDEHIKKAVDAGVKLAINSDSHSVNHIHFLEFGVAQARRGWAKKSDIINAWPLEKMLKLLKESY